MAGTAIGALQTAIYSRLIGDATLMGIITGVYDDVNDATTFPYITIGDWTENRMDTFGRDGKELTWACHIWSRYRGNKELYDILNRLDILLDDKEANLNPTGFSMVEITRGQAATMRDPDGITRHMAVRYRIRVTES